MQMDSRVIDAHFKPGPILLKVTISAQSCCNHVCPGIHERIIYPDLIWGWKAWCYPLQTSPHFTISALENAGFLADMCAGIAENTLRTHGGFGGPAGVAFKMLQMGFCCSEKYLWPAGFGEADSLQNPLNTLWCGGRLTLQTNRKTF